MRSLLLNGCPVAEAPLGSLALNNYGHFTTMQVRGGGVQGLPLHFQRLQSATLELFGSALNVEQVRGHMREAVEKMQDCSLRVTVFSRHFDYRQPAGQCEVDVLVSTAPPRSAPSSASRIRSCVFSRFLPHIKHVGTFPLFHHRRLAQQAGWDDALFVDAAGAISEGSLWNVGFIRDGTAVWPDAPALGGTTLQLLQAALAGRRTPQMVQPVRLQELSAFEAAFACNASGVWAIGDIDGRVFGESEQWASTLAAALAGLEREPI